jgi:mediator of RNA polymerase II transcription subunit 14
MLLGHQPMQQRGGRFWRVEFVFHGNPVSKIRNGLNSSNAIGRRNRRKSGEKSCRKTILLTYEVGPVETLGETVESMLKEWSQMVHLFALVDDLEAYLQCESLNISNFIGIKTYSFKEVTLEYGPSSLNARSLARITWDASRSRFAIIFGGDGAASGMCPHVIVKDQLVEHLNHNQNLALLGKILHETYTVVLAMSRLPTTPQVGVTLEKVNSPVQTFSVLPQSPTHFKLIFYNTYCLDIHVRANGLVYIRDSAISLFDQRKAMEDLQPIPLIKTFLMKYVDEAEFQRRQSHTEDDNPPSPQNIPDNKAMKFPTPHTPPTTNPQPPSPHGAFLQSPPSSNLRQPSPASNFTVPSPINPNSVQFGW